MVGRATALPDVIATGRTCGQRRGAMLLLGEDGSPVEESVSPSIVARGQLRDGFDDDIHDVTRQLRGEDDEDDGPGGRPARRTGKDQA